MNRTFVLLSFYQLNYIASNDNMNNIRLEWQQNNKLIFDKLIWSSVTKTKVRCF